MRGATIYLIRFLIIVIFLLTRLMRGATVISDSDEFGNKISTHAPHARRDNSMVEKMAAEINFYSRASCEARQERTMNTVVNVRFLLTRLMRGATPLAGIIEQEFTISTHAPHARRDNIIKNPMYRVIDFYSRASCEARLAGFFVCTI